MKIRMRRKEKKEGKGSKIKKEKKKAEKCGREERKRKTTTNENKTHFCSEFSDAALADDEAAPDCGLFSEASPSGLLVLSPKTFASDAITIHN
jgi:hypothetical protein